MAISSLEYYLRPRTVAIVGASQKRGAIGNTVVKNLADLEFKGKVFCVNPRYEEVEGFPCFPTVKDIPEHVDVAVIAVPGDFVESAIKDCADMGVSFALILSAGFAEMGEEGLKRQNDILKICQESGLRIIGPNTVGTYNIKDKISLSFTPVSATNWLAGNVGVVTQSGAVGGTIVNIGAEEEIGFSYMFTLGNQMDLTTIDMLESMIDDSDTNIITSYMEAVPDGKRLKEVAKKALHQHKPFIVYKSGRSEAGQKAALSHTASLTGSNATFELVAERYGVTTVDSLDEIIDAAKAFNSKRRPKGNRVATIVISGATGIMIADNLSEVNHQLAELSEETKQRLREVVPSYLPIENPVDIASTLMTNPILYKHCIQTLVDAEEVDSLIVHLPIGVDMGGMKFANDIIEVANTTEKPIIVLTVGSEQSMGDVRKVLNKNNVSAFNSVQSATKALSYLLKYENVYKSRGELEQFELMNQSTDTFLKASTGPSITEPEVKRLLSQFDIPIPQGVVVKNHEELMQASVGLEFPLVAKIVSAEITHKSDVGGVILPIKNIEELNQAFETIRNNVRQNAPNASIEGILVEELVQGPFLEAIVGVTRDPAFGPVIMCGLGGIYVEVMKDVSQRLAPITEQEAMEMIQQLKSYPIFNGVRKGTKYDVEAFAKTLSQVSKLALNLGDSWSDIEINPMIIREKGKGVMALDGLITFSTDVKETVQQ
ncbi:acetate--CoA ligase family protein [Neobacillus sp. 179-C4.2 HS]|uniref:Acetate--CoA ligase family protein n=1 Tax=Neobacillus driksii TaxID=3035913 RepID=A0ABV4YVD9_9BACI|nr:acetate--CoA ligase family protein [Neobacillus sp. 179.-C4.2 HS]MDP5192690.1 acetate--CoA ligase family protein [Neobacillus sp. 179.-C4.2 HS]